LIYALFAYPIGVVADKISLKKILVVGLFLFAVSYTIMAISTSVVMCFVVFLIYGIFMASTEGISKALISNITNEKETATAIGTYAGFQSISSMIASAATGFIWYKSGPEFALMFSAIVSAMVGFYFIFFVKISNNKTVIN
jgi:MFS family permease